eukprot:CAMPEP_0202010068 /NCGR_PEP_ID=MMETSP0905-20130828/16790_1 /ASSEMBLY_ACC=CAM_ASM_000554 /TAXON_ID=420261 /ORGANISM="Thalassiosira antarctica, Strain CCMP982" /LENGTH=33 /DNA_ID= /DNA_START= /DNA_END= /DNA_ORIENTATION=
MMWQLGGPGKAMLTTKTKGGISEGEVTSPLDWA